MTYSHLFSATGGTPPYQFECEGELPDGLVFSPSGQLTGNPAETGTFEFRVTVTDSESAPASAYRDYSLTVTHEPVVLTPASLPDGVVGTPYNQDFDASGGGTPPYSFSLNGGALPGGLAIAGDGALTGIPDTAGTFNFSVRALDATQDFSGVRAYSISIAAPVITIAPSALPGGNVGIAYQQPLSASGGTAPHAFAILSGDLPAGMSMDGDGIIDGTPEEAGDFTFTVTATDAFAQSGEQTLTLSVAAADIQVTPDNLSDATVGNDYAMLFTANGGVGPYTFLVTGGSLPPGLYLDGDGTLHGAPATAGDYSFTVTATDTFQQSGARSYTLTVASSTIHIAPASIPGGTVGNAYSQPLSASGGTAPYSFMVGSGSLPAGMGMDGDGIIDGTPEEPGSFVFTVIAMDAFEQAGERTYSLEIAAPTINVAPATLPGGNVGDAYQQVIAADGGNAPYAFSISNGALPTGLHLDSDGTLGGMLTASGTFAFTILATDNFNQVGERSYSVTVGGATVTISPATLPAGAVGTAYAQALSASGGVAPYSFVISSGSLPIGMAMDSEGVISGTPEAPGSFAFAVTAMDSYDQSGMQAYTLSIDTPSISISPGALPEASLGEAFNQVFSATGGTAPYAFTIGEGALPAGLVLASDGTLSGQPGLAGIFEFTVVATDAFEQTGSAGYSLAVSAPALPDPTQDAEVTGVLVAQVNTVQTFVNSQVMNVHDRLESLHDGGGAGSGGKWGFWVAGSIRSGDRSGSADVAPLSFETSGMTGGTDYRPNNNFAFGGGLGFARDRTAVGGNGGRNDGDASNGVSYMSWHPEDLPVFLDGMGGYQELEFDVRRFSSATGTLLQGRRNGKQKFTSWSGGYEHRNEDDTFLFSPYARVDAANARLDSFSEDGSDPHALHFGPQDIDLRTTTLGFRMKYRMPTDWGEFEPRLRVEYQHDYHDDSGVAISFANQQDSPVFFSTPLGLDRNRIVVELGSIFRTNWYGLLIRVDYLGVYGGYNDNEHAVRFSMQED